VDTQNLLLRFRAGCLGVIDHLGFEVLIGIDVKIHSADDVSVGAFLICKNSGMGHTYELFLLDSAIRMNHSR